MYLASVYSSKKYEYFYTLDRGLSITARLEDILQKGAMLILSLHRTVSAVIEARRLRTDKAAMIVHSFSPSNEWLEDYQAFVKLFRLNANIDEAVSTGLPGKINLLIA